MTPLNSPNSNSNSDSSSSQTKRALSGSAYSQRDDPWGETLWDSLGVHAEGAVLSTRAGSGAAGDLGRALGLASRRRQ